ncbi:hypothetical protein [Priestia megaterium]|uniref:hypothetical protein n=1 Tax=Priestia megaterium TaxID=1404 RepID=UPI0028778339|nr:hypothetical protein [Priestia megaterium]
MASVNSDKKICLKCLKEKNKDRNFYKSSSKWHGDGLFPYCKQCLKDNFNEDDMSSVREILRVLDKPFLPDTWDKAKLNRNETLGTYLKDVYLNFSDYTYDQSSFGNTLPSSKKTEKEIEEPKKVNNPIEVITDDLINKWGEGYDIDQLKAFERKYSLLKNNYQEKTAMHTEALLTYIRYRVKEEIATAQGDIKSAKDWGALAQKAAQDAKINPSQLSKSDLSDGLDTFGQLVRSVEQAKDIIPILPQFKERPQDKVDFALLCYINYVRDLKGLPLATYDEVYAFYEDRKKEYASRNGDE